jgi:hypothetical protein
MSKAHAADNQSVGTTGTDYRPAYILVGVDDRGAHHLWDRETDTVHIIREDGGRGRKLLDGGDVNEYADAVADAYGWQSRRLHRTLGDAWNNGVRA